MWYSGMINLMPMQVWLIFTYSKLLWHVSWDRSRISTFTSKLVFSWPRQITIYECSQATMKFQNKRVGLFGCFASWYKRLSIQWKQSSGYSNRILVQTKRLFEPWKVFENVTTITQQTLTISIHWQPEFTLSLTQCFIWACAYFHSLHLMLPSSVYLPTDWLFHMIIHRVGAQLPLGFPHTTGSLTMNTEHVSQIRGSKDTSMKPLTKVKKTKSDHFFPFFLFERK